MPGVQHRLGELPQPPQSPLLQAQPRLPHPRLLRQHLLRPRQRLLARSRSMGSVAESVTLDPLRARVEALAPSTATTTHSASKRERRRSIDHGAITFLFIQFKIYFGSVGTPTLCISDFATQFFVLCTFRAEFPVLGMSVVASPNLS